MIYNRQFRFRNNHSITHALIDITEKIRSALDKGIFACGIYIDLLHAFDTVNHNILMLMDKLLNTMESVVYLECGLKVF